jgi:hypothetical protein
VGTGRNRVAGKGSLVAADRRINVYGNINIIFVLP